jgi:hypothetical protein
MMNDEPDLNPENEDENQEWWENFGEEEPAVREGAHDFEKKRLYMRQRAEKDLFYFARNILGFNNSKIRETYTDDEGNEKARQKVVEGPEWGISPLGPHKDMLGLLTSGNEFVHIEAPRGSYKSTVLVCWITWLIVNNPNIRIFYAMDTYKQARKRAAAVRQFLEKNRKIRELWPEINITREPGGGFICSNRTDATIVDPTLEAGGPDCDFTGSHFDVMVLDDIVNFQNIKTVDQLEKTREFFDKVQNLLDPGSVLATVGTRYHEQDLWADILSQSTEHDGDWHCLVLDCGMELYQKEDKTWDIRGTPLFAHLDEGVLRTKLHGKSTGGGHRDFSSQFLNRCLSADDQMFFREQFDYTPWRDWMLSMGWYVLTDTAVTKNDHGCFSVIALVGVDALDHAYLAKIRIGHWKPVEFKRELFDMIEFAREWKGIHPRKVLLEENATNTVFHTMFEEESQVRKMRVPWERVKRGMTEGSKDQRIMSLEGRFESKRFHVLDTVDKHFQDLNRVRTLFDPYEVESDGVHLPGGEVVDQFIKFPASKWKDIPDALADLEARDKNGQRICRGRGHKGSYEKDFGRRVGQVIDIPNAFSGPKTQERPSRASRADMIRSSSGGRYR